MTAKLSKLFDMEPLETPQRPTQKHELTLCMRKEWLRLRWKPDMIARYDTGHVVLDAVLLNELVLRDILGIEDAHGYPYYLYRWRKGHQGVAQTDQQIEKQDGGIMLYPVAFDDMLRMADAAIACRRKSTYFSPRLKSGILVQSLFGLWESVKRITNYKPRSGRSPLPALMLFLAFKQPLSCQNFHFQMIVGGAVLGNYTRRCRHNRGCRLC